MAKNTVKESKTVQLDANGKRKFGIRDSVAYAAGDLGCNMSFALKGTMAIFWTQIMGMSAWYSILLVIVQIWDAINDPIIGSMIDADNRQYKRNKFLQYIFVGSIGLIVGGACVFIPVPSLHPIAKAIIFIAGYVVWDAFYTIANVPYGSLLSLISTDPSDRASLSAWRSIGGLVGNMVPMVLLPILIYDNNVLNPYKTFATAFIMGIFGFVCFMFMIKNTEIRVEQDLTLNEEKPKFNIIKAMGNFLKNRPAIGATLAAMGMFIGMQGATTAVTVTFQSYFKNTTISGLVSAFAMIPIILFTPLARKMVKKYGKKELSVVGSIAYIAGAIILFAGPLGIIPVSDGNTGIDLIVYVVGQLVCALGLGIYSTVSWAMMGDAIDYNEWKTGSRDEGVVYSLHSFFRKLAQGVGPAVAIAIMTTMGYVNNAYPNTDPATVADIPYLHEPMYDAAGKFIEYTAIDPSAFAWDVSSKIRMLVAVLYLVAGIMQFVGLGLIYNLDKKTLAKMNKDLGRDVEADDVLVITTAEDNDKPI